MVCRMAWQRGYMAATDGNVSLRLDDGNILITPSGRCKQLIEPDELILVDPEGKILEGNGAPSSEGRLHYLVYRNRPDITAVVHAHPPLATAMSVAGRHLDCTALPELMIHLGSVPTAPYATPTTDELPVAVEPYLQGSDALLLDHHGTLTMGSTLERAWALTEKLEHASQTLLAAEQLGGAKSLGRQHQERLLILGREYGLLREAPQAESALLPERVQVQHLPETAEFLTQKRFSDARGKAHMIVNDASIRRVALLSLEPDTGYRGNHVHHHKTEGFYVAAGRAKLDVACSATHETMELELAEGDLVWMPPGVAHRIKALEPLTFVELTDRPYEKADDVPFSFEEA